MKIEHEDWTQVCIQMLPDICRETEKFMQLGE